MTDLVAQPRMRRAVALAVLLAVPSGCGDQEQAGLKAFCETYKTSLDAAEGQPTTAPDFGSPPPAGLKDYERALELAATSGNERVKRTHADLSQQLDEIAHDPRSIDEDRYGDVFIAAYLAAVEECDEAGYPVV